MKKILFLFAFLLAGFAVEAQTPYDTVNVYDPQNFTEMTVIDTASGQIISRKGNLNRRIGLQTLKTWITTGIDPIDTVYIVADTLYILQGVTLWEVTLPSSESTLAANGLTLSGDTVILGGTLNRSTTVTGGTYGMTFSRNSSSPSLTGSNLGSGTGVNSTSSSGYGILSTSTTGLPGRFRANPSSTNTTVSVIEAVRGSSGTPANNIGVSIDLLAETTSSDDRLAGRLAALFTDATDATRTSRIELYGVNSATTARKLAISGPGQLTLDGYATWASFQNDTTSRIAALTPTGEVVWRAASTLTGGAGTDDQVIDTFTIVSNVLRLSLESDGEPFKSVDLSPYLDNTDAQTLSVSNDTLTISGGNSVRVPGNGFIRDSVTTTTLTVDLARHNNAVVVLKMESATNLTLTINNPWSAVSGSYPNQSGETGVYTFRFAGISGTDNVTWPANFYDMGGTALGTDALTAGTAYTCFYDPVAAQYFCK